MTFSNVLIVGSSGFIGQHLCKYLSQNTKYVLYYGNRTNKFEITDKEQIGSFPNMNIDIIIHLAAKTSITESIDNPYDTYFTNVLGTLNLLEFARLRNIRKLIYVSTYVYGQPVYLPVDENHPINPHSPYGKSKVIAEQLCLDYSRDYGIDIVVLRPFNIYGPGAKLYTLISSLISQIKNEKKIILIEKNTRRDFVFIKDLIMLISIVLNKFPSGYNVYNVGSGKSYTLEEVIKLLSNLLRQKVEISYGSKVGNNYITDMIADISKVSSAFNWRPSVELQRGLQSTLAD